MIQFQTTQEDFSIELQKLQYKQPIGRFKPKFVSIPQEYYPLTHSQILCYILLVISTIALALSLMIGFLFWITKDGLESFVQIWSILFILFVLVMIMGFYVGGSKRIKEEKRMIIQAEKMEREVRERKEAQKHNE